MHTMDTMGTMYGHKKYRPPISPTSFYHHDYYSRHATLRPQSVLQSEYRFAGGGYPRLPVSGAGHGARGGGLCSAALVAGALLAAVAVLAVAALAFYMGALRPDNGEPIMTFEGNFRVTRGDVYGGVPGSPAWNERARRYSVGLRQALAAPSALRQAFVGAMVTGFGDRKLDVHFRIYLDRRKIPSSVSNIEDSLKNIIVQDLLSKQPSFGQIKIDINSIAIKRDLKHTYHSESQVMEALNETLASYQPKQLSNQNGSDKTLQSRIGVVRKTTVKPNQPSKKRDPDEPDIDTENIPVVQGSFQITKTEADITENKHSNVPAKRDEKLSHKPVPVKSTTTTKAPTTKITITQPPITKATTAALSTSKLKPFTIMSNLGIKTRTTSTQKPETSFKTTKRPPTRSTTPSTTTSTTTVQTTTVNVSQILFDLLTNDNHDKDLPKIDTLFTVPHVIDNEPWRPITRPYYETTSSKQTTQGTETASEPTAKDRIGVAEVVEDISMLESMLSPIPPIHYTDKTTRRPSGLYNIDPNLAADIYVPSPVYTSFTLPTFAPPLKDLETLGSMYPKPFPLPVDKIGDAKQNMKESNFDDVDDGKPIMRPPKDKTTSAMINVLRPGPQDNSTERVSIDGTSILKIHNLTISSTTTSTTTSTTEATTTITSTTTSKSQTNTTKATITTEKHTIKENTTRRPNDKVSIIPTTDAPYHTWELVNTSTNDNDTFAKNSPEKFYNDTLQAIITRNDATFPNTTPKFPSKISILRNLTDLIKKYAQSTKKPENLAPTSSTPVVDKVVDVDDNDPIEIRGSVEVIPEEEIETTTARVITLMPVKSNLGVNRPLRPRPKIKNEQQVKENLRSFFNNAVQAQKLIEELNTENYIPAFNKTSVDEDTLEMTTSADNDAYETVNHEVIASMPDNINIGTNIPITNNRFPKSSSDLGPSTLSDEYFSPDKFSSDKTIPEGTYRVSYHVTGSVSSKQANKTKNLPAYELALEPDVVLEIPINQSNTLTFEKLKQLASLASITDYSNSSLFRRPGGVISTKAIPSSYTLNQAGFKILTKTYHKTQPSKQEDNSFNVPEKTHNKPQFKPLKEIEEVNDVEEDCSNATSFRCPSGLCLPNTSRCNRLMDCPGGEDERACSCADYLRAEFSQAKICDGIVDCWDYSDENKCEWCNENQYVCSNARQCIDMSRVCDGTPDCPLGDDEKTCVALSDEIEDNEVVPYNEEGFVMVRKRGEWGRLCVENFADVVAEAHSSLQLPDLGRAICRAMTFSGSRWSREAREGRIISTVGYWEVWHNAEARAADTRLTFRRAQCPRRRALRVRCQDLACGVRPHADVQQPRRVTDERVRWGRVVGGGGAAAGAWPWQAALYRDGDFQCGATLIADQWLLSASHCFYQATEAHWVARLGALRRGAWPRGPWERVARVRQLVLHPRYAARGFRNDIALLRVDRLQLHARLRPACLPPARAPPPAGTHCSVVGWGQLYEHERVFPDTLQEVELPVISTAECRRRTRLLPLYRVTEDMFCAGYERGGRDACLGDSGGPLMCQEDGKWYIYGVTSNGYGCARANRPGVYTKVSNYIEWVDSVIDKYTPRNKNDTFKEDNENKSNEDFYADLETAENRRRAYFDTCKGFRCPLGECLPTSSVCNGFLECSDGSDESNCNYAALNSSSIDPD
ncbi:uncharacterized protein LOC106717643 isoform X1 [Papilio machaon]|uniref:uncharacterized protein LOC106717643 isoform X1 n=1 Tax=Papilio machaon TaxID=76193 RepID=UPI001E663941|nr:uncharacterized protein LOC106717643 isoform X1 [Papilio machaon]